MGLTTLVMLIGSAGFLILGLTLSFNRKLKDKIIKSGAMKDGEGYLKFNSIFYLAIGIVGIILSILEEFIPSYGKIFVIIFIVVMVGSSISQSILGKKYR